MSQAWDYYNKKCDELKEKVIADIGENVYLDIEGFRVNLSKFNLAERLCDRLFYDQYGSAYKFIPTDESFVVKSLETILVKFNFGKREIPLIDLLPIQSQANLIDIFEKYASRHNELVADTKYVRGIESRLERKLESQVSETLAQSQLPN